MIGKLYEAFPCFWLRGMLSVYSFEMWLDIRSDFGIVIVLQSLSSAMIKLLRSTKK